MRLRDFLEIVETPKLVISNICKMALGSNHKGPYLNDVYTERGGGGSQNADECR